MNCAEFEASWNELLDTRSAGLPDLERALEAHASVCASCRPISTRYRLLRQAVAVWGPPPAPSLRSVERLRALTVPTTLSTNQRRLSRFWVPLAAAAAVFALAWIGGMGRPPRPPADRPDPVPNVEVAQTNPLGAAIAEATLDLAREASGPAARIGREMIDFEGLSLSTSKEIPQVDPALVGSTASDLLQTVGERVNAGVKPISGSARHAFSFLLGPPPGSQRAPVESSESL